MQNLPKCLLKVFIPKKLKIQFKACAALIDQDMSSISTELISQWVETQNLEKKLGLIQ